MKNLKVLLTEWKAVGRGEKSADAAQWERFKAAREKFNSARSAYLRSVSVSGLLIRLRKNA